MSALCNIVQLNTCNYVVWNMKLLAYEYLIKCYRNKTQTEMKQINFHIESTIRLAQCMGEMRSIKIINSNIRICNICGRAIHPSVESEMWMENEFVLRCIVNKLKNHRRSIFDVIFLSSSTVFFLFAFSHQFFIFVAKVRLLGTTATHTHPTYTSTQNHNQFVCKQRI